MKYIFLPVCLISFSISTAFSQITADTMSVVPKSINAVEVGKIPKSAVDTFQVQIQALRKELLHTQNDIANMKINLGEFHRKYKTGTALVIIGWAGFLVGTAIISSNTSQNSNTGTTSGNSTVSPFGAYLFVGGFVSIIVGQIKMISSHRYIGKAGKPTSRFSFRQ